MKIKQMEFQFKDGSSIYLDEDRAKELYLKLKELYGPKDVDRSFRIYPSTYAAPQWVTGCSPEDGMPYMRKID